MRFVLTKAGLDSVRLNLITGVCGTCRGCRVWEKPCMLSCRLLHYLEHSMSRGAEDDIPDKTMTNILDAHHQCSILTGKAHSITTPQRQSLRQEGIELRMRARGQHATTIEARSFILRRLLHVMQAELNRLDVPLVRPSMT
eukprot:7438582-Pyramimonas_sp.AAC.1